ncbi:UNVERIFIED_CONTAM: Zinc finger protein ZAT3 [Sesamum radiatum]|uniref:Zinc finger protein ZAT3 n=1 Tax=Sesamum radiatum TaxID=300843 RepID=A0AAW2T3W7_SESRA
MFLEKTSWGKLQFPKEEESVGVGDQKMGFENKYDQMNEYSSNMKRVCHICYKVFSSGKALGGHMRIHVLGSKKKDRIFKEKRKVHRTIKFKKQNPREEAVEKAVHFVEKKHHQYKKMTTGNRFGGSDDVVTRSSCAICGKKFPSMKSLFGHMRCHPDREWRGIHPPPSVEKISSSSSSLSDAEPRKFCNQMELSASGGKNRAVDLTESLRGWPVTAKRGRKATAVAASSSEFSCSDDDQFRAVTYLMMLASGHLLESGVPKRQSSAESQAAESKAKILEIDQVSKSKKFGTDYPVEQLGKELSDSSEFETVAMDGNGLVRGESVNKLEGQEWLDQEHDQVDYFPDDDQLDNMIPGQLNDKGFETTCNFKVPIKNKKKRKKLKLCELELAKSASPTNTLHQNPPDQKHQCKACDKAFATHQALGGHMSSHYKFKMSIQNTNGTAQVKETKQHIAIKGFSRKLNEETQNQCKTCDTNSSTAQAPLSQVPASEDTQICRIMLDIDLNEAPPSDGEAGVGSQVSTYTW